MPRLILIEDAPTKKDRLFARPDPSDASAFVAWQGSRLRGTVRERAIWLWEALGPMCPLCEQNIDILIRSPDPRHCQVDHLIPVRHGGLNVWGNVRVTHAECNSKRAAGIEWPVQMQRDYLAAATDRYLHAMRYLPAELAATEKQVAEHRLRLDGSRRGLARTIERGSKPPTVQRWKNLVAGGEIYLDWSEKQVVKIRRQIEKAISEGRT